MEVDSTEAFGEDGYEEVLASGDDEAYKTLKMTAKVPPAFDGHTQTQGYFAYEENVEEWVSITTIEPRLRGPLLRNRLIGGALRLKRLFDMASLSNPDIGVKYFLATLRPHFIKDNEHVFLRRFLRFLRKCRGMNDITMWIPSWSLEQKRLSDSWMHIAPVVTDYANPEYRDTVARENQMLQQTAQRDYQQLAQEFQNNPDNPMFYRDPNTGQPVPPVYNNPILYDPVAPLTMDHYNTTYVSPAHQRKFPIGDHLMTLIFLANSDFSEQQRERLTSHLALRGIMMHHHTLDLIFTSFRTLFTSTKTGIADRSIRPGGLERSSKQRSCYLFEAGESDGEEGYLAIDEFL
jgi:hypothetical protein